MPKGIYPRLPAIERLLRKVQITSNGCWLWQGKTNSKGYGVFWGDAGREVYVHRFSYEHHIGPIPPDKQIDHLCRNRACANPAHLEAVTPAENIRRGERATKTHCINGHPFNEENTYRGRKGWRYCRRCGADSKRRARARG